MLHLVPEWHVDELSEEGRFNGYASIFNVADSDHDVVMRGAFAASLNKRPDVKLLWQHDARAPIGRVLALQEDARGLHMEAQLLLDVQQAREAYSLLKAGAIRGLSIGYRVEESEADPATGLRLLTKIELLEISLVTFPANELAGVTSVKALPCDIRAFEHFLREAGYSRKQAKAIACHGFEMEARDVASDQWWRLEQSLNRAIAVLEQ